MEIIVFEPKAQPRYKLRVCAYCRVSSMNDEQQSSIDNQVSHYRDLIANNPDYEFVDVFYDNGISGRTERRPGFQKMLAACRAGTVDLIITKSISRFARNTNTMLKTVRELRERGIGIFFELQNINTLKLDGELLLSIYAAFAQAESENTGELLTMSHLQRIRSGDHKDVICSLYGYSKTPDGSVAPDANAKWVRYIFEMAAAGRSATEITKVLNHMGVIPARASKFSREAVVKILHNSSYAGIITRRGYYLSESGEILRNDGSHNPLTVEHGYEPIISKELWESAQSEGLHEIKRSLIPDMPLVPLACSSAESRKKRNDLLGREMEMPSKVTVIEPTKSGHRSLMGQSGIKRFAAYCRVSTAIEDQRNSYENQVDYYTRYFDGKEDCVLVGIYGDEGKSGVQDANREGFMRLIEDCKAGKIDFVITKSLSRFARNTRDCLKYIRELRSLGIPVMFEKEGLNSMDGHGELLITILSSLAQEESRNISENVTWAYQKKFQQGKVVVNAKRFLGFDKDENGDLIINEQQAELVRRIYHEFEDGFTETMIAHRLNSDMVPGIFGKPSWDGGIIAQILTNEKYKGDLLLQKTYVPDYLKKRSVPNNGQREQYYIKNDHEAIIPRDEWEAVQLERARRAAFKKEHDVPYIRFGVDTINPFAAKIICGYCGDVYKVLTGDQYKCRRRIRSGGRECKAPIIHLRDIELGFCEAWKKLMQKKKKLREKWNGMIENGNPLEKLRGRQFLSLADQCITEYSPELALKVLERVELHWCSDIIKYVFYDGSEVTVQVEAKREN